MAKEFMYQKKKKNGGLADQNLLFVESSRGLMKAKGGAAAKQSAWLPSSERILYECHGPHEWSA
jgi:hypothetical protein